MSHPALNIVGLNLGILEGQLCKALQNQLGNIKIVPLLKDQKVNDLVHQRYVLYYSIEGGVLTNRGSTGSIDCPKSKKVAYELTFQFHLKDLRTHTKFYPCADELICLIDGLPIGHPFGQISVTRFSEPNYDDECGFYTWTINARVVSYYRTKMLKTMEIPEFCD